MKSLKTYIVILSFFIVSLPKTMDAKPSIKLSEANLRVDGVFQGIIDYELEPGFSIPIFVYVDIYDSTIVTGIRIGTNTNTYWSASGTSYGTGASNISPVAGPLNGHYISGDYLP